MRGYHWIIRALAALAFAAGADIRLG